MEKGTCPREVMPIFIPLNVCTLPMETSHRTKKKTMKIISYLPFIFAILLVSCQSESEKRSEETYIKGLEELEGNGIRSVEGQEPDYNVALAYFAEATSLNPDNLFAQRWKVSMEFRLGKLSEAHNTILTVINNPIIHGHDLEVSFLRMAAGMSYELGEDPNPYLYEALGICEKTLERNPKDVGSILDKASILCYLERHEEAREFLDSISLDGEDQTFVETFKKELHNLDLEKGMKYIRKRSV